MIFNMENEETNTQPEVSHNPIKDERKLHDRTCPYCKQPIKTKIGVDNWKNLFKKPTVDDWITLVILILLMVAAFAYTQETATCRAMTNNIGKTCMQYYAWINNQNNSPLTTSLSLLNYTSPGNNNSNSSGNVIGGEKDEHGCIIPAGYSWCEDLQECIKPWEKNCTGAVVSLKVTVNVTTISTISNSTNVSTNNNS